jgi:hypothetical protein
MIGSMCVSSDNTVEELGWNDDHSRHLRKVVTFIEERITKLCADWTTDDVLPSGLAVLQQSNAAVVSKNGTISFPLPTMPRTQFNGIFDEVDATVINILHSAPIQLIQ